jgi:hypothetical protein
MTIKGWFIPTRSEYTVFLNGRFLDPQVSQRLMNHSPDGFSWGYSGRPTQLALAVCLKDLALTTEEAVAYYFAFRDEIIAKLPQRQNFDEIKLDLRKMYDEWKEKQKCNASGSA